MINDNQLAFLDEAQILLANQDSSPDQLSEILRDLNAEQLKAVTYRTGPLLIVAGAGTGKTKVLTHRIAYLIATGRAKTNEILALTFTEKAAAEMEIRVDQLLPYGINDVLISTFHAFGDRILREYALDLGLPAEFRVIDETQQQLFLQDRYEEIEEINILRPIANPTKFLSSILKVINRAKDELITPLQYLKEARSLARKAKTEEEKSLAQKQLEIARIYTAYEDFKAEKGIIDFGDQILLLIKLIDQLPSIAHALQNRFKFILIDEFQDTNIAQYQLIKRLLNKSLNLTVIGDDDQAIYKFRGAAASNILDFLADFPACQKIVLTQNYRSIQSILDLAHRVIANNNPDRLEEVLQISKQLISTSQRESFSPQFKWYEHEADELTAIVAEIKQLKAKLPLNQIAILSRSNNAISAIASALKLAGIPHVVSSDQTFIYKPEIVGAIAFLKLLAHPTDSVSFVKLALSPLCQLEPEWILMINDVSKHTHLPISLILDNPNSIVWRRLPEEGKVALSKLHGDLKIYRRLIGQSNAGEILYQFLKEYQVLNLDRDNKNAEGYYQIIQNLAALFEVIKKYLDTGKDPFLLTFVDNLDFLLANIVSPDTNVGPEIEAVQILTVHAAKGLEFDTVFVPFLVTDRFPARARHDLLELPTNLIKEHLPSGDIHLQEERRLVYVALTRAKHRLYLSGAKFYSEGVRAKKISPFAIEAFGTIDHEQTISLVNPQKRIHTFSPALPVVAPTIGYPQINGILNLSPAAIETYLRCPYEFYWRYVLKVPIPTNHHLVYGIAVHAGIETYHRQLIAGRVDLDSVLARYHQTWKSEGFLSQNHENQRFDAGIETLKRFFDRTSTTGQPAVPQMIEENFVISLPQAKIRGRMDAVFAHPKEIRDFKTSAITTQKEAQEKLRQNLPLKIYALAYKMRFGCLPDLITLDFVEAGIIASLKPSLKLIEKTKVAVTSAIEGIKTNKFDPNPRQHWCEVCHK